MRWEKLDLEVSLKPFQDRSAGGYERVAEQIFRQWKPLIDESVDPSPESKAFSSEKIFEYLGEVTPSTLKPRNIPRFFPEETTRAEIATGLIRTI